MKFRELGKSGINASVIALGTWVMGGGLPWGEDPDDTESIRVIHEALERGINFIDTAPVYGFGRSERVVGQALRGRRDKVIIATKCGLWWDDERGSFFTTYDGRRIRRSLRPDTIRVELEHSLRRLETDTIDLYQTHWQSIMPDKTPIADTMACLLDLKREGKIRAIGVSNATLEELKEYSEHGEIVSNQPRYSLIWREVEKGILPWCIDNRVSTLAYMPLEHGLLTGKVGAALRFGEGELRSNYSWNPWFKPDNRVHVLKMLEGWADLAEKYRCSLASLVLACTVEQPGVTHVLCGARKVRQVVENALGGQITLSPEDVRRMREDAEALGEPA